jgi:hypothetical protein
VLVSDPHPIGADQPEALLYSIAVDAPMPRFAVPLAGEDVISLDLQGAYNATYSGAKVFARLVDYKHPPVQLDTYSKADQRTIQALMREF